MSMAALYSGQVTRAKNLPALWLISDARNDASLERSLAKLPRGSGFIYRHYHCDESARRARYEVLAEAARKGDHVVILSGPASLAQAWGADGIYGQPEALGTPGDLVRLATAHDAHEIALANAVKADAILLSPVFPTRSHPGGECLGVTAFRNLAAQAEMPVIALGGMTASRARAIDWPRWAAIDGLS
jgi:thiamine-phosphate pyrophosphorylase